MYLRVDFLKENTLVERARVGVWMHRSLNSVPELLPGYHGERWVEEQPFGTGGGANRVAPTAGSELPG